jgi:hypothetical protein
MTSQVALFNHRAVVIASDTIATNGNGRAFVSEKLVPLSEPHRVAIALRGMVKFMGVEATVLLHAWESSLTGPLSCLDDYVQSFREWLTVNRHLELTTTEQEKLLDYCYEFLVDIRATVAKAWDRYPLAEDEDTFEALGRIANTEAEKRLAVWEKNALRPVIPSPDAVNQAYLEVLPQLDNMISDIFTDYPLSSESKDRLRQIFHVISTNDLPYDDYIGLYFAGFGADDRFPRGIDLVMYSLLYGDLLATEAGKAESDENFTSRIVPLAQDAAMRGFLQGFEPMYLDTIKNSLHRAFRDLDTTELGIDSSLLSDTSTLLDTNKLATALGEFVTQAMRQQGRTAYIDEVLNIIEMYSPHELARMAEALVGIQSLRSESGTESPTVGGEIEVLTVTRHDGHRWIKRRNR